MWVVSLGAVGEVFDLSSRNGCNSQTGSLILTYVENTVLLVFVLIYVAVVKQLLV